MMEEKKYRVLIYGGFKSVNRELSKYLPAEVELSFLPSTRKRIDVSGMGNYDLIVSFWTNISHSAGAAVKGAARRKHIPYRMIVAKGAEMASREIVTSLCA